LSDAPAVAMPVDSQAHVLARARLTLAITRAGSRARNAGRAIERRWWKTVRSRARIADLICSRNVM
jgi:hypothetical protein